jgi:hypothetical protein
VNRLVRVLVLLCTLCLSWSLEPSSGPPIPGPFSPPLSTPLPLSPHATPGLRLITCESHSPEKVHNPPLPNGRCTVPCTAHVVSIGHHVINATKGQEPKIPPGLGTPGG